MCWGREWELQEGVGSRDEIMLLFFSVADAGRARGILR